MSNVRQIASKAGVSIATVSRSLNNHPNVDPATRQRVFEAAASVGYSKANSLRTGASTVIALAYAGDVVRADYGGFESAMLAGILRGVNERRFDVCVLSLHRDLAPGESYARLLDRKKIAGTILRVFEDSRHVAEQLAGTGLPSVVVADRYAPTSGVNYICCESRIDSRRAVQHLIDLGHRRIALGVHSVRDTDHVDRRNGYEDALRENAIPLDHSLVSEIVASPEGGAGLITRLMSSSEPPTAVYFTDPMATIGALRRCLELGIRVPQDLSIVGFDDSDTRRHTFPSFTAVVQDAEMLGFEAARWLTRRLANPGDGALQTLQVARQTRLEINQTTGRPPKEMCRVLPDGTRVLVSGPQLVPGFVQDQGK
ncbi:MAG: LacI family transcriptional regulator [Phycisphaerales bacterium]|nr:LacI family transcriptional regulator [Phycisphaerales bacterium]